MIIDYTRERQGFIIKVETLRKAIRKPNPKGFPSYLPINMVYCEKDSFFFMCGIINMLWQEWNKHCQRYWELFMFGGKLSITKTIPPILPRTTTYEESIYQFLEPTHYRYSRNYGKFRAIRHQNEPTWGCYDSLAEIGSYYSMFYPEIRNILGALSVYGTDVKHLQIVRNSCFHLNKYSMTEVKQISSQYSLSKRLKYPSDLSFASMIGSSQMAFNNWCDSLIAIVNRV